MIFLMIKLFCALPIAQAEDPYVITSLVTALQRALIANGQRSTDILVFVDGAKIADKEKVDATAFPPFKLINALEPLAAKNERIQFVVYGAQVPSQWVLLYFLEGLGHRAKFKSVDSLATSQAFPQRLRQLDEAPIPGALPESPITNGSVSLYHVSTPLSRALLEDPVDAATDAYVEIRWTGDSKIDELVDDMRSILTKCKIGEGARVSVKLIFRSAQVAPRGLEGITESFDEAARAMAKELELKALRFSQSFLN